MVIDLHRRWSDRALCHGEETKIFFTLDLDEHFENQKEKDKAKLRAIQLCNRCPVKAQCRRDTIGEPYGYWGGLTAAERKHIRDDRSRTIAKANARVKRELATIVKTLRDREVNWVEIERVVGLNLEAVRYLYAWASVPRATVVDLPLPGDKRRVGVPTELTEEQRVEILNLARARMSQQTIANHMGLSRAVVRTALAAMREDITRGKENQQVRAG